MLISAMQSPVLFFKFNSQKKRAALLLGFFIIILLCSISQWPELFAFATNKQLGPWDRLLSMPVILDDDVMITFRSGAILEQLGYPGFNRHDLAQPSTSFLAPYLYALLAKFLANNLAVALYAVLGMLSVAATMLIIYINSKSSFNALILILLLVFSSTSLRYSLNGWDHLFQALFLVIAASIFLANNLNPSNLLFVSCFLAISCLWRPDAVLVAVAIIVASFIEIRKKKDVVLYSVLPFIGVVLPFILHNFIIFGHVAPTTARLKIGASPAIEYSIKYLLDNGLLQFSAISIVGLLGFFYFYYLFDIGSLRSHALVISAILTSLIAIFNSDAFVAGRMFWTPACVLAAVCGYLSPPILSSVPDPEVVGANSHQTRSVDINNFYWPPNVIRLLPLIFLLSFLVLITGNVIKDRAISALITTNKVQSSPLARQYVLTRWIDQQLDPRNGPIGYFFLGLSYHIDRFEIADFMGKADELIANSNKQWGPPGHNKWNFSATLDKWNPQAIVPPQNSDFSQTGVLKEARSKVDARVDYGFGYALIVEPRISNEYDYCFVNTSDPNLKDKLGLYLRKDISINVGTAAVCKQSVLVK